MDFSNSRSTVWFWLWLWLWLSQMTKMPLHFLLLTKMPFHSLSFHKFPFWPWPFGLWSFGFWFLGQLPRGSPILEISPGQARLTLLFLPTSVYWPILVLRLPAQQHQLFPYFLSVGFNLTFDYWFGLFYPLTILPLVFILNDIYVPGLHS